MLSAQDESTYSEDQLIYVEVGTPAAVKAVVKCSGPEYALVNESYMDDGASSMTVVGSAEAQARIPPKEVADAVGVGTDEVVSRYEKELTTDTGGVVGFVVSTTGTGTDCSVQLTDRSNGTVLADEDVVSSEKKTVFPLWFPKGRSTGSSRTGTRSSAELTYPSGDPVLPGYPVKVSGASIDYRVIGFSGSAEQEYVALAPGVYAPYTPIEPDLSAYLDGPNQGDCTVRAKFFPNTGGSCWSGVGPGSEEPPL
ncbi:hypothetical protein [Dietzia alimentaria]|uniref:hypothetical protein n=1 Tax=Dietzia alimentaria TaxID=665550 RepID=UPI0004985EC6|nr:hypothetical protein [Dietzia alimentaria]